MLNHLARMALAYAAATLLIACDSSAARIEFLAMHKERRVAGAEVCFYRAGADTSSLELFLQSGEVRCFPADNVINVPVGRFLYYVRHPGKRLTSWHPSVMTVNSAGHGVADFKEMEEQLTEASWVDVSGLRKADNEWVAIYVASGEPERMAITWPIVPGESGSWVPANNWILPMTIRNGLPVAASRPIYTDAPRMTARPLPPPASGAAHVLAWSVIAAPARQPGDYWLDMQAPEVFASVGDRRFNSALPARPGFGVDNAFYLFENVPHGDVVVHLRGEFWSSDVRPVRVGGTFQTLNEGLVTQPGGSIELRLPNNGGTAARECDSISDHVPFPDSLARVLNCGLEVADVNPDLKACRSLPTPGQRGENGDSILFPGIVPGRYVAQAWAAPGGAKYQETTTVAAGKRTVTDVRFPLYQVRGRLTLNGDSLGARLKFATGTTTSSAESGEYVAELASSPKLLPIEVRDCTTNQLVHLHVPKAVPSAGSRYDIDVATNRVTVHVIDNVTGRGLAGADVDLGLILDEAQESGHFIPDVPLTDGSGKTVVRNVTPGETLLACATADGYERECSSFQKIRKAGTDHTITVRLKPETVKRGKVDGIE